MLQKKINAIWQFKMCKKGPLQIEGLLFITSATIQISPLSLVRKCHRQTARTSAGTVWLLFRGSRLDSPCRILHWQAAANSFPFLPRYPICLSPDRHLPLAASLLSPENPARIFLIAVPPGRCRPLITRSFFLNPWPTIARPSSPFYSIFSSAGVCRRHCLHAKIRIHISRIIALSWSSLPCFHWFSLIESFSKGLTTLNFLFEGGWTLKITAYF